MKAPPKKEEKKPVWPVGTSVLIDGLSSEAGKCLNGRTGTVRGQHGDRMAVQLSPHDAESEWKRVRVDNLALPGEGICRYCHEQKGSIVKPCGCGSARPECIVKAYVAHLDQKVVTPQCPDCGTKYVGRLSALCLDAYLAKFEAEPSRALQQGLLRYFEAHYGSNHQELLKVLDALVKRFEDEGDKDAWRGALERKQKLCAKIYGQESEEYANVLFQLSLFWTKDGDAEIGHPLLQRGSRIKQRVRNKKEAAEQLVEPTGPERNPGPG